jgi:hypothetical protein
LIILLISGAMTIFFFWISSQYLGQENFRRLPEWLVGAYQGIWTSAGAGAAGVGLAIAKAFSRREQLQPNYLKYIGITTFCMLIPITVLIAVPLVIRQDGGLPLPAGVSRIDVKSTGTREFELADISIPGSPSIRIALNGSFAVSKNELRGHLKNGTISVPEVIPPGPVPRIDRISFRVCYIGRADGREVFKNHPQFPKSRDSVDASFPLNASAKYEVPAADFSFDLPDGEDLGRAWLCGGLQATTPGQPGFYIPVQ